MSTTNLEILSVSIRLKGQSNIFNYRVNQKNYKQVKECLRNYEMDSMRKDVPFFIIFETKEKVDVAVSVKHIQSIYFLFDSPLTIFQEKERENEFSVYFDLSTEPIEFCVDDPVLAVDFYTTLDTVDLNNEAFYSIEDNDGEYLYMNLREIALVEIDSDILKKGMKKLKEDQKKLTTK